MSTTNTFPTTSRLETWAPAPTGAGSSDRKAEVNSEERGGDLIPVRVKFAFHAEHRGARIPFFNILEEGHPLGYQSSLSARTLLDRGYRMVEEVQ